MQREKLPQIDCNNNNNNSNEWGASSEKDTVSFYFNYAVHVKAIDFGNCPVNQQQFSLNIYLERRAALSIDLVPDRCNKSWRQRYLLEFRWFVEFSLAPFPRLPIFLMQTNEIFLCFPALPHPHSRKTQISSFPLFPLCKLSDKLKCQTSNASKHSCIFLVIN